MLNGRLDELERNQLKASLFESADDLADEVALHAVRLRVDGVEINTRRTLGG